MPIPCSECGAITGHRVCAVCEETFVPWDEQMVFVVDDEPIIAHTECGIERGWQPVGLVEEVIEDVVWG